MQGIEAGAENVEPRVTVDADGASARNRGVQRAADAASAVSRALSAAGYEPRHLSVTSSDTGELVLVARLEDHVLGARGQAASSRAGTATRLAIGITLGVVLGFLGLPRLELPGATAPAAAPTAALPRILSVQDLAESAQPTPPLAVPTATALPQPTAKVAPALANALFDRALTSPIPGWTNDSLGTAWFGPDGYRLFAREAGRFVATSVPLGRTVQDVTVSAAFRKMGGPPGGGYGLILRDQSPPSERDGRNQSGRYLVFEVGDRGDIGVWQREETRWIDVVPWQRSDAVQLDRAANALTVSAHGSNLQFHVNGTTVADLTYDNLPTAGGVGIFVGGDLNEVALEMLRIDNGN